MSKVGHYVVVVPEGSRKKHAGLCVKWTSSGVELEVTDALGEIEEVSIPGTVKLIADLGEEPANGSVYGCQIRRVIEKRTPKIGGTYVQFRELEDSEQRAIFKALKRGYEILEDMGLASRVTIDYYIVEPPRGRYAGMYRVSKGGVSIVLHPPVFDVGLQMLVNHEFGHAVWHQAMRPEAHYQWVLLYKNYVQRVAIAPEILESVVERMIEYAHNEEGYSQIFSDSEMEAFHLVVNTMATLNHLQHDEVLLFLESCGDRETREDTIPAANLMHFEWGETSETPITDYAMKNVKEFFAEAYCHYLANIKLPKDVVNLLESTTHIKRARNKR